MRMVRTMAANYAEVLSAFFDGEEVDSEALAESLQQPDAIDLLQEFARLRRTVQADASRPDEEFSEAMRERLAEEEKHRHLRHRLLRLSVAASLLLASGV